MKLSLTGLNPDERIFRAGVNCVRRVRRNLPPLKLFGASGQELVEFAIIIPVLILFAFGVLDLARTFHAIIALTNAAREGVRYGMTSGFDSNYNLNSAKVIEYTCKELNNEFNIQYNASTHTCPPLEVYPVCLTTCAPGQPLEVTVKYPFKLLMAWILPKSTLNLVRSTEMMIR